MGAGVAGASWQDVLVGDFNGDGRSDLAVLDPATGYWHVELSTGTSFTDSVWSTSNSSSWSSVMAADLTGNGLTDLVGTVAGNSAWQVALSTGLGFTISSWGNQAQNLTNEVVGDFEGDGKDDIAGQVAGTNDWHVEISNGTAFTDTYWITTSAAIDLSGAVAGNTLGLTRAAAADFETVYNDIQYQPYNGEVKGPLATEETGAGNDWDQDALLCELLNADGIQTQYVTGTIEAASADVESWLGVKDSQAAYYILQWIDLDPQFINQGQPTEELEFTHTWIQARLPGSEPGVWTWYDMDPSFKPQNMQPGITGISSSVPFDQTAFLSQSAVELPLEYYEDAVVQYLQQNDPTQSIADVPYSGTIEQQQFNTIPPTLPFNYDPSTTTTYATIPWSMQERVVLNLAIYDPLDGNDPEFQYELSIPQVSLDTITIDWVNSTNPYYPGEVPDLRINGNVVATGFDPIDLRGGTMVLTIDHYGPGNTTDESQNPSYDTEYSYMFTAGFAAAIGLDGDQFSNASILALQNQINTESLADENAIDQGQSPNLQPAFEDGLFLNIMEYFKDRDDAASVIAGLFDLKSVHEFWDGGDSFSAVGDGIVSADPSTISEYWDLNVPIIAADMSTDIENPISDPMLPTDTDGVNPQDADRLAAFQLLALQSSARESFCLREHLQYSRYVRSLGPPIDQPTSYQ